MKKVAIFAQPLKKVKFAIFREELGKYTVGVPRK